jgi:2-dehydropantoate 2-reductase
MNSASTPAGPRVCIVGAGAIGGFIGVQLAHGGVAVSALARGATLAALRGQGWTLETGGARIHAEVRAEEDPSALGVHDVVVLAVKAYSLAGVVPRLAPLIGPSTAVVAVLNGVPWWFTDARAGLPVQGRLHSADPDGTLAAALPDVIGGVIYAPCSALAPGVIRHTGNKRVVLGETTQPPGAPVTQRVTSLVELMRHGGIGADATSDLRTEAWKKLLGNVCFNPVSFITGTTTDALIDDPQVHALFVTMMEETMAVGHALGLDAADDPVARIAQTRKAGRIKSSMLQDAEAGRPVELDGILGTVIELAEKLGIATPACRMVYALAHRRAATFGLLA